MLADYATVAPKVVKVGLIGCGISQSRTPGMHMAEARAQGFSCDYQLLDMEEDGFSGRALADILDEVEAAGYAGVNVTYPYKQEVISLLDELSVNADAVGAVNTVIFSNGKRVGHNTDFWGFEQSFKRGLSNVATDRVLLIGAGGAGGAVAHALARCGVSQLSIHDVDMDRAEDLAAQVCEKWSEVDALAASDVEPLFEGRGLDGVVNATPMGMAKLPGSALPVSLMTPRLWVADIVYFPLETQLLKDAKRAGCRVLPGTGMAVFQAVRAFELFTGQPADPIRMRATFDAFTNAEK